MKDRIQTAVHELLHPVSIADRLGDAPGNYEVASISDSALVIRSGHGEYHQVIIQKVKPQGGR